MIIDFDHNPNLTEDQKLQSLKESVQMALDELLGRMKGFLVTDADGNLSLDGNLTLGGHRTEVGYRSAANNTKDLASGTASVKINGEELTLSAGTWVLVGAVDFPANSTGVRNIRWNRGSTAMNNTLVTVKATDGGFNTRLQTTALVKVTEPTKMYLYGYQNSGSSLTVNWYWQAIRIA